MVFYWREYNFMYFHYPKTGGCTFTAALEKALGPSRRYEYTSRGNKEHLTYLMLRKVARQTFDGVYKVMTARNPWARFYSHWKHAIRGWEEETYGTYPHSFEDYILMCSESSKSDFKKTKLTAGMRGQWKRCFMDYCKDNRGVVVIDNFIPIEKLQHNFNFLCKRFGVKSFDIGKKNASGPQDNYKSHYTNQTQKLVSTHCQEEIEYFNYLF